MEQTKIRNYNPVTKLSTAGPLVGPLSPINNRMNNEMLSPLYESETQTPVSINSKQKIDLSHLKLIETNIGLIEEKSIKK